MERQLQKDLVELMNADLSYQLVSKFIDDTISVNINKFSIQLSQQCYKRLTQIFENKLASIKILLLEDLLFAKVSPKMPANKMIIQSFIERFK